ncbi:heme-binding protein [Nitratidesulfovibrio liaohensis]|nr:heme-binding protein [Nitratidesulfovibrio liaohensis]
MAHEIRTILNNGTIRSIGGLLLAALLTVGCCMAVAPPAQAAPADAAKLVLSGDITLAQAQKVIAAAQAKAVEQGTLMNIAVVDAGGNLKAFARMEGAFLGSIDISIGKARTARFFNMSTKELGDAAQPGQPLYGIEVTNGNLVIFGGGELLRAKDGTIIGAVGVSGSSVENDMAVAKAGVAALN